MFDIKQKLINSSLLKGKKQKSEKFFQNNLKNLYRLNKKSGASLIKLTVGQSYFVFNANRKGKNVSYFYVSKNRLAAAIKETNKHKLFKNLDTIGSVAKIVKERQEQVLLNKKFMYFYRWSKTKNPTF